MPEIEVKDRNNNTVEKITLSEEVFGVRAKQGVLHEAVVNYLANQRQGNHATKTKGLISGGGKKPWRQKHTGRARAGSSRSPLWRGGGTIFGPQPRDYSYHPPKKMKKLALLAALREKLAGGEIIFIDSLSVDKPKTKDIVTILRNLGLQEKSVLIVLPEKDDAIILSARNIPGVSVMRAVDLNTYEVLAYNMLLMTKEAAKKLEGLQAS
ncbi:MAG: 50S ribosomal protein L4 [Thermodesulfovibrionales bacterium]|nr:50S ribosomal protein L4 [Thermodesulfovibrionales bacterium]